VSIAERAAVCEVSGFCRTTVFQTDNVINSATEECVVFVNQAILAKVVGSSGYKAAKLIANIAIFR
jgi:hypothetical protein